MDNIIVDVARLCQEECKKIAMKIAHFKQLDKGEILCNYLPKEIYFREICNEVFLKQKKTTTKRCLPCGERCLGRKMDLSQCTRKRKDGSEFCGSHMKNLPNGKIGDDGSCFDKVKGKRGRKPKTENKNADKNHIMTTKFYIGNELYLKDEKNIVYTYNQDFPVILGIYDDKIGKICDLE